MKVLLVLVLIIVVVVLATIFGPSKPQPKPAANPGQPTTAGQPQPGMMGPGAGGPAGGTAMAAQPQQPQQPQSARQRGELSVPVAATGVTLETVDVGGGGAVFEAKRRMTDKLDKISPSGRKH